MILPLGWSSGGSDTKRNDKVTRLCNELSGSGLENKENSPAYPGQYMLGDKWNKKEAEQVQ